MGSDATFYITASSRNLSRAGLPKRVQHYVLFQIDDDVTAFRKRLRLLIPLITTTTQVQEDRQKIAANKKAAQEAGKAPELLKISGINIAFSHSGLVKVCFHSIIFSR